MDNSQQSLNRESSDEAEDIIRELTADEIAFLQVTGGAKGGGGGGEAVA
ncbi:hypothetical protein [Pseudomonas syringae]|nr:hypothetical protein [Pseudomonas syringae]